MTSQVSKFGSKVRSLLVRRSHLWVQVFRRLKEARPVPLFYFRNQLTQQIHALYYLHGYFFSLSIRIFCTARIVHVAAIVNAVNAENQSRNVSMHVAMTATSTTFITLVATAGLSLLLMLGSMAIIKQSCATEITMSCQRIRYILADLL